MERLRIGELLVQAKLVSPERLESALAIQRAQGRKLGQVLIDLGIVNETQLTQALGQQLSVPWVSLYHIDFSRQLLNLVPREVAEKYCLIPIFVRRVRKHGETLYVAMDDPTHEAALDAVRASSSLPVRPMIAAPTDIRSAIRVYYYDADDVSPKPAPPGEPPTAPMTVRSGTGGQPAPAPTPALADAPAPLPPPPPPPVQPPVPPPAAPPPEAAPAPEVPREEPPKPVAAAEAPPPSEAAVSSTAGDSPDAWPEVEARTLEIPVRKGGPNMVALTLLDGTTIQLPAKPRRRRDTGEHDAAPGPHFLGNMTARDLIKALGAVAEGADAREVFGERVPMEAICAALLSLLLRKGVIADWEFVEEIRKRK